MEHYDRRLVYAPAWMEHFACLAGDCPDVCCQQWNVDVDPTHAESLRQIGDPELQELMDRVLRTARIRRPGSRHTDTVHRLQLLNQPDKRCPLLNGRNECRLQKKYGPYVLCDTCYFHPRAFFQIDDRTYLSACLSCEECARLAVMQPEPTAFAAFEAEIDPGAEWLETELIADPSARSLLNDRDDLIRETITRLQDRALPLQDRIARVINFLLETRDRFGSEKPAEPETESLIQSPEEMAELYLTVFDPLSSSMEKAAQSAARFTRELAGGRDGYAALLARNYSSGRSLYEPFISEHPWLEENFLVHCVFSDSFRQFYRYQNEPATAGEILQHEARLITAWYWFFRVLMCSEALRNNGMTETLFLKTVARTDKTCWHYPDWFARCAENMTHLTAADLKQITVFL